MMVSLVVMQSKAIHHSNTTVAMYVVDSFNQLSIQYLDISHLHALSPETQQKQN
jgi:hypothetical protein